MAGNQGAKLGNRNAAGPHLGAGPRHGTKEFDRAIVKAAGIEKQVMHLASLNPKQAKYHIARAAVIGGALGGGVGYLASNGGLGAAGAGAGIGAVTLGAAMHTDIKDSKRLYSRTKRK